MEAMKSEHPVMEMADALEVSASGYAEHLKKDERPRRREDQELGEKLTAIFKANRKTYGTPRLQIALGQQGIRCGKQRNWTMANQRRWLFMLVEITQDFTQSSLLPEIFHWCMPARCKETDILA